MPKAIIPISGVNARKLLTLPGERNAGDRAVKATTSTTSRTNGPNSGLATSLWRSEVGVPNYLRPAPCMILR